MRRADLLARIATLEAAVLELLGRVQWLEQDAYERVRKSLSGQVRAQALSPVERRAFLQAGGVGLDGRARVLAGDGIRREGQDGAR